MKGEDLHADIDVTFDEAVLGGTKRIHLRGSDGKEQSLDIKIPAGIESGKSIRLRGKGIVSMKNPSIRGDQYVTIQIQVPQNLNYTAKEKLHEYARACGLERSNATGSHVA